MIRYLHSFKQSLGIQAQLGVFIFVFGLSITTPEPSFAETETEEAPAETSESTDEETSDDEKSGKPKITLTTKDWLELERPKASEEQARIKLLLKEVDQRELVTLSAGEEEFIGLFLEYNTAQPLGAVLMLHDEGLHPDNNQLISPLRKNLPNHGWNTLAIAIPTPDSTPLPTRKLAPYPADFTLNPPEENEEETEEESEPGESTDTNQNEATPEEAPETTEATKETATSEDTATEETNTASKESAQQRTMARIEAAVQDLMNRGQLNIVLVGQGIGASWAISYLESSGNQEMFTLVMVDPKLPKTEEDQNYINTRLAEFADLPILDIISQQNAYAKKKAKERMNFATRKRLSAYQQLFTRPVNGPWTEHHRIVKRVRGWLGTNAPGEELPAQ